MQDHAPVTTLENQLVMTILMDLLELHHIFALGSMGQTRVGTMETSYFWEHLLGARKTLVQKHQTILTGYLPPLVETRFLSAPSLPSAENDWT